MVDGRVDMQLNIEHLLDSAPYTMECYTKIMCYNYNRTFDTDQQPNIKFTIIVNIASY
jgi:hypothetical protein